MAAPIIALSDPLVQESAPSRGRHSGRALVLLSMVVGFVCGALWARGKNDQEVAGAPAMLAWAPLQRILFRRGVPRGPVACAMTTIVDGVEFDTIAREWRCKWSPDGAKKSLADTQKALNGLLPEIKKIDGVKDVQRVVCGGCLDFKVVTSLPADKFGQWEEASFAPEAKFLDSLKAIDGITNVETQTYTLMPVEAAKKSDKEAMTQIVDGVEFNTIAREWRCKWDPKEDKKSLAEAQKTLNAVLSDINKIDGVEAVQRVVCGGCLDFKVIISFPASKFGEWEKAGFNPEAKFLEAIKTIEGISMVETQTYTLMPQ